MRILGIAPPYKALFSDRYGGIERVVVARARALQRAGHTVEILGPPSNSSSDLPIIPLKPIGTYGRTRSETVIHWAITSKSVSYSMGYPSALRNIHKDYDVVINDALRFEPWTGLMFLEMLDQSHSIHVLHAPFALTTRLRRLVDFHFRRLRLGFLSTGQLRLAERLGFRCCYTPNGIEIPPISQVITEPAGYIVFIGRMDRQKAPHLAIDMSDRLGVPLKIIGPVADSVYFDQFVRPRLSGRVTFLGEVPRTVLTETLRSAEALAFTSQFEDAQPAVLQEALSYGVPVLGLTSSLAGGYHDIVIPGENGIDCKTLDEVGKSFRQLKDIDRMQIYSRTAQKWSWDAVVKRHFEPLLNELRLKRAS